MFTWQNMFTQHNSVVLVVPVPTIYYSLNKCKYFENKLLIKYSSSSFLERMIFKSEEYFPYLIRLLNFQKIV